MNINDAVKLRELHDAECAANDFAANQQDLADRYAAQAAAARERAAGMRVERMKLLAVHRGLSAVDFLDALSEARAAE
ncbi:hypothetical protein [Burkholderia ubonensis]|uniref:hypothetical protein n=1 Tax=Burkholderia ubonensis TaxID=101571 RepID=UPI0008FDC779|nr:hypothetical protein [Burkholderia ubonensis]OJA60413.1 hypothetical protein BGV69_05760 [Burkholderia ubonensis]